MELQIGNNIKNLRRQHDMTQEKIAGPPKSYTRGGVFISAKSPLDWGGMRGKNLMKRMLEDVYAFLFSKNLVSRVWQ